MQPYELRLPSYRSAHLESYHPYPRTAPSTRNAVHGTKPPKSLSHAKLAAIRQSLIITVFARVLAIV
ncbi:hypothetical protein BS17DRAFT_774144 [Gyrodon lividus]|nr:hypothetical protein BS17DRAFT_774144 [Gyrodon lividus]